jgi:hypothetical protein
MESDEDPEESKYDSAGEVETILLASAILAPPDHCQWVIFFF